MPISLSSYENDMLTIKTPFTFWDTHPWDMWQVCLQTFRNNWVY